MLKDPRCLVFENEPPPANWIGHHPCNQATNGLCTNLKCGGTTNQETFAWSQALKKKNLGSHFRSTILEPHNVDS